MSAVDTLREACLQSKRSCNCALQRVGEYLGKPVSDEYFTSDAAAEIGFSRQEAYGIMDGWDSHIAMTIRTYYSNGFFTGHRPQDPESYDRGFEVGKQAAQITLEAGLYVR